MDSTIPDPLPGERAEDRRSLEPPRRNNSWQRAGTGGL